MIRQLLILLTTFSSLTAIGQVEKTDSLKRLLNETSSDSLRIIYYCNLSDLYYTSRPDSALYFAQEGLELATDNEDIKSQSRCLTRVGNVYKAIGKYPLALEKHLESLKLSESIDDQVGIAASYSNMGEVYKEQGNHRNAVDYYNKAETLFREIVGNLELDYKKTPDEKINARINSYKYFISITLMNMGDNYERMDVLDSAKLFQEKAFEAASLNKDDDLLGAILSNLGALALKSKDTTAALNYYRASISYLNAIDDQEFLAISYSGMGEIFEGTGKPDSALFYARKSLGAARAGSFTKEIFTASDLLSRLFEKQKKADSAFFYKKMAGSAQDTMFAQENLRKIEEMNFGEKIRQQEIAIAEAKAAEARRDKLQYIGITIFIVIFFLFLVFLRKRKAKAKLIEYSGIIGLLLMFEFVALFLHPVIAKWTHHKPIYMLLILAGVAGILTPLHHMLTHWIKHRFAHHPHKEDITVQEPISPETGLNPDQVSNAPGFVISPTEKSLEKREKKSKKEKALKKERKAEKKAEKKVKKDTEKKIKKEKKEKKKK